MFLYCCFETIPAIYKCIHTRNTSVMQTMQTEWDGKTWMTRSWQRIKDKKITEIILPGSHNSATANLSRDTANDARGEIIQRYRGIFGKRVTDHIAEKWNKFQPLSLTHQLEAGVRYLELNVGVHVNKEAPETTLRCCHGFFSDTIGSVARNVSDFCITHSREFVILDFRCLHFQTRGDVHEEATHLLFIGEIEKLLGNLLVPSTLWHQTLSSLCATSSRVFVFYPLYKNSSFWHREWMIPGDYVDRMQSSRSATQFLKDRITLFAKVQEEKKQQIMSKVIYPKRESLFILHEEVATPETQIFLSIISACIASVSGERLTLCGVPDSVSRYSADKNGLLMAMIEKDHQKPFLNVILLDYIDSCELVQRIAELNIYSTTATTRCLTRNSFANI